DGNSDKYKVEIIWRRGTSYSFANIGAGKLSRLYSDFTQSILKKRKGKKERKETDGIFTQNEIE
ncbi:MAG: hypothetical protein LUI13_13440, partial [Lachnospiraceae bacterium]|nr:hypothetical protein [Lachnospiraceae bacterium]